MNIRELKEAIKDLDDDVEVYVYADHGQVAFSATYIDESTYTGILPEYSDEDEEVFLCEEDIEYNELEDSFGDVVTAIRIS
jgi:hypothetical protein